jgi:FAD dependent oxidoreductase TIGR03364
MSKPSAIVVGAGIVGLAMARALAIKGYSVKVFDRSSKAIGASIRNFGMLWPIGQPEGVLYERAIRSREIWKQISGAGVCDYDPAGSLHLAYHADEWQVLQELYEQFRKERKVHLLSPQEVQLRSGAVQPHNLLGGLYSEEEAIIDPVEAIHMLPSFLQEQYGVGFYLGKCISYIADNTLYIGQDEQYPANLIVVCSGADFETLYPEAFLQQAITKCKLQMMRFVAQPDNWRIGPALCGGLSLIHYKSFATAPGLPALKQRYEQELDSYLQWGIHVMVAQNNRYELTVGDSHEYGLIHAPFDKAFINDMVLTYLKTFAVLKDYQLKESWNGVYAKLTNGEPHLFFSPEPGVYILNGLGGAGMTLSFGLAEEIVGGV